MFDLMDQACAEALNTDVDTFVKKIESTTSWRREVIINCALDCENKEKIEQAIRCFNLIK